MRTPASTGRLRGVLAGAREALGPASTARQIVDLLVLPLFRELGLDAAVRRDAGDSLELCDLDRRTCSRVACLPERGTPTCGASGRPPRRRQRGGAAVVDRRQRRQRPAHGRLARLHAADDRLRSRSDRGRRPRPARPSAAVRGHDRGSAVDPGDPGQRLRAASGGGRPLAADRRRRGADASGQRLRPRIAAARRGARSRAGRRA